MSVAETYQRDGYVHLPRFLPNKVGQAFLLQLGQDIKNIPRNVLEKNHSLLKRSAIELYGYHYTPLLTLLWGMTPAIEVLLGRPLLPSYSYFRIYRQGDVCRVHSDRQSCEVSLSLTLAYGDGKPWALEMATDHLAEPKPVVTDDFGGEPYQAVLMAPGDAVLYQGVHRRHGRVTPNPNSWSAHLFLHWVDPEGPYKTFQGDGRQVPEQVRFSL
jgi:hypothetical protein